LVHIVAYIGVGFLVCWFLAKRIYDFLAIPLTASLPEGSKLAFTKPTDPFILYMKVAFLAGIFLTMPLILYEVWKFIAPGLYKKEKRFVRPLFVLLDAAFSVGRRFLLLHCSAADVSVPDPAGILVYPDDHDKRVSGYDEHDAPGIQHHF
jgi:sec-independent protein translocase protein TatC